MDDVTALRDALLEDILDAEFGRADLRAFRANLDALIAAVEARAAITPERLAPALSGDGVYDLLDRFVHGEGDVLREDIAAAILAALPARSAGSGSRVEAGHCCEHAAGAHAPGMNPCLIDGCRCSRPTPPPAPDGPRCAECGGVKDDVFHVPCLVGGPFHYVKTCHPFTPPTPAPARARCPVDGCDELPEDHHHPAPDRLRALGEALDHAEKNLGVIALTLTNHPEYPMKAADVDAARSLARFTAQDIRAARALLADGERSE